MFNLRGTEIKQQKHELYSSPTTNPEDVLAYWQHSTQHAREMHQHGMDASIDGNYNSIT